MPKNIKLLMIDDHPLILEGYKSKLLQSYTSDEIIFFIDMANNCDEAYSKIKDADKEHPYDVVILDIGLPASKDNRFLSGEDIGRKLRKISPQTSLIVLTMFGENLRLLNILKNLNPEAFLIKSDITPTEFLKAFEKVLEGKVHYSQSIINLMRRQITTDVILNENDRAILYHLSEGVRTKDLIDKVPLSLAGIEKRKKVMKEIFEVEDGGDLALINKAKKMGFL
ncbi:response regulator [Salinimicrobium sp. MT39]|uniref:Response regulator n=1 Tax=Salinimicrobium profundisediminis TaxID=2994553 RepID=A0A9X3CZK4_9FLAO|nr:response regulator [Salinimicrobium profundisediminis]MCX2839427.1 response regulator [Salinimicrobium profundisediminis]